MDQDNPDATIMSWQQWFSWRLYIDDIQPRRHFLPRPAGLSEIARELGRNWFVLQFPHFKLMGKLNYIPRFPPEQGITRMTFKDICNLIWMIKISFAEVFFLQQLIVKASFVMVPNTIAWIIHAYQRCKNVPTCQQYWCKKNPIWGNIFAKFYLFRENE